jgi:hypothetical protein
VYGYLLFSRTAFVEAIRHQQWIALSLGVLCLLLILVAYAAGYLEAWESAPNYTPGALIYQAMPAIYTWAWLVFVLACGIRWLNFTTKRLPEANEAVLPFYVLQQPAIVLVAFYVVQWPMGIAPKWLVITTLALALTLVVYGLVIRPVNWLRWLFGMKPRPRLPPLGGKDLTGSADFGAQGRHQAEAPGDSADQAGLDVPLPA